MKRILINATHNEEIRVALCKGNHMYDFDLENRTREQKKANIYKAHVTRVEPSLEAVFVEYGAERQGFLPIREIAKEYLAGNPRTENIRDLIKEGDTLIVQVEKEERGNKGAALSTYISLAGRYLVLMPNNPRGGGISRQISGKQREEMKRIVSNLQMPKGMSIIIRTAGIGKSQEDLQHDLDHLLNIWRAIGEQDRNYASPRLVHQEAGVVTRALRDYMRDDIAEIWIDNENAYNEAVYFIKSVMPKQLDKLRKYTDYEPMFARFGIEKQIETAYQREVRLPSGGSIVIDQTEAMVAIDINSAKSTKGSDVAETAYHTNLEAAEEIARQLRLRDMGGLVVIDFIDMYDSQHQKEVEKNLVEATKFDRARVQFGEISKFGLMEMSRQRLRPSLEESTGYKCPRCHGTGMIRDLRSLSLSIMRQIEQIALNRRQGEVQAEVPTDVAAFLLNEKRDSLVYLEQDSGTRITILPHAHMESPDFELHYNADGFAPSSYERISDSEDQKTSNRGYEVNWQTADNERPEQQPTRKPKADNRNENRADKSKANQKQRNKTPEQPSQPQKQPTPKPSVQQAENNQPQAVAWLSNLFAPTPEAQTVEAISSQQAAEAIESIVNNGGQSLGSFGQVDMSVFDNASSDTQSSQKANASDSASDNTSADDDSNDNNDRQNKRRPKKYDKGRDKKDRRHNKKYQKNQKTDGSDNRSDSRLDSRNDNGERGKKSDSQVSDKPRREPNSKRNSRGEYPRGETLVNDHSSQTKQSQESSNQSQAQQRENKDNRNNKQGYQRSQKNVTKANESKTAQKAQHSGKVQKSSNPNEVNLHVSRNPETASDEQKVVHLSLDKSKPVAPPPATQSKPKTDKATTGVTNEVAANVTTKATTKVTPEQVTAEKQLQATEVNTAKLEETPATEATRSTPAKAAHKKPMNQAVSETSKSTEAVSVESPRPKAITREDGRANNDPRVVREQLAKQLAKQLEPESGNTQETPKAAKSEAKPAISAVAPSRIVGNVGEFLRTMLDDAQERIEKEGVIACFIDAMAKYNTSQAESSSVEEANQVESTTSNTDADNAVNQAIEAELAKFDFSNYGYQMLSSEYLSNFNAMTASVAQFDTSQGKTETQPTAIGKRASNDPRGQHPDYEQPSEVVASVESVEAEQTATEAIIAEAKQEPTTHSASETDEFASAFGRLLDEEVAGEESSSVEPKDTAVEDIVDESEDSQPAMDTDAQHEATTDAENKAEEDANTESDAESDENKERIKTTFDKYKSMLADVSEQLSTQTGTNSMFLSTPAVPKTRSRRKKEDE